MRLAKANVACTLLPSPSFQGAMNGFYGSIPVQKLFNANDNTPGTVTIAGANVSITANIYLDVALGMSMGMLPYTPLFDCRRCYRS